MKKALALLLLCLAPLLCGCGSLYGQRRELEQLRLMETLGLDAAPGGLILSLCSSPSEEEETLCCTGAGVSLSQAMEKLRRSSGKELFCGHLQTILVGESYARQDLEGLLSAVCRSSDLRLDQPVFLVLDGSAREALESGSAEGLLLPAASRERAGSLSTAGGILRDLERQGSSLIRTLRLQPSPRDGAEGAALVPAGYGILAEGKLLDLLPPEEAAAAELLTGRLSPSPLLLRDGQGRAVTLELQDGESRLRPLWDEDGALTGLEIHITVRATLLEIDGFPSPAQEDYRRELCSRMEAELTRRVGKLLERSRDLGADFLGLGRRLELASPLRCRGLGVDLAGLLPSLALRLRIQGEIEHSNDMT